jgi:hypothetical protein
VKNTVELFGWVEAAFIRKASPRYTRPAVADAPCGLRFSAANSYNLEDDLCEFVERCQGCDWWMHPGELVDEEGEVVGCDQCRPKHED